MHASHRGWTVMCPGAAEVALWDLYGRLLGRPVYELLGGAERCEYQMVGDIRVREVTPYCTIVSAQWDQASVLSEQVAKVAALCDSGYRAVKVEPMRSSPETIVELARLAREALGSSHTLCVDVGYLWNDVGTALRRALGQTEGETNLLVKAARQARAEGQYQRATALLEDSLSRHRALGDRGSMGSAGLGLSLYELGLVLREQGQFGRAAMLYDECVQLHRKIGDREGLAIALLGQGDVARDQGDVVGVRKYSEGSLALCRNLGIQSAIGFALNKLALAAYWRMTWSVHLHSSAKVSSCIVVLRPMRASPRC